MSVQPSPSSLPASGRPPWPVGPATSTRQAWPPPAIKEAEGEVLGPLVVSCGLGLAFVGIELGGAVGELGEADGPNVSSGSG